MLIYGIIYHIWQLNMGFSKIITINNSLLVQKYKINRKKWFTLHLKM